MGLPSAVGLAAVWTPNPDHPYTWAKFLSLLAVVLGFLIALVGCTRYAAHGAASIRGVAASNCDRSP